jgi:hypothetical protein
MYSAPGGYPLGIINPLLTLSGRELKPGWQVIRSRVVRARDFTVKPASPLTFSFTV